MALRCAPPPNAEALHSTPAHVRAPYCRRLIVEYVDAKGGQTIGGADVDRALVDTWVSKLNDWDGNLFVTGASKGPVKGILGSIEGFRLKYAEARCAAALMSLIKGTRSRQCPQRLLLGSCH